jgi:ABC-type Mn2+/Zn2+ transport system permease subunit
MPPSEVLFKLFGEPFSYLFMQKAFLIAILLGVVTGVVGAFVVIRGMAFFAEGLSHAVVPGIAVVYVTGGVSGPLMFGAMVAGAIAAVLIGFLTRGTKIRDDTAVGIVLTGAVALGVAILSLNKRAAGHLDELLVGNILAISNEDVGIIVFVGVIVLLVVRAFYKELVLTSFDPVLGTTLQYPVEGLRYLLLVLLALTAVISIQAVGAVLITAMLTTPAATAYLLVKRIPPLMALSAVICAFSGVLGVWLAWHVRVSASAAIILTMTFIFVMTYCFAPPRGLLWEWVARRRESQALKNS